MYKNTLVSLIGPRNRILHQCPIINQSTVGPESLGTWKSEGIEVMYAEGVGGRPCYHDRRGKKGGCDLFSSPSSQKQIIQQLIHNNANDEMSSTSISLLDCTHLYEKFAVRERYHSAFAVTRLCVCFWGSCSRRPIVSPMVVLSIRPQWSMQSQPQFTRHTQNMMSALVMVWPQNIRKKRVDC